MAPSAPPARTLASDETEDAPSEERQADGVSEATLIARCRTGDTQAFQPLVLRYRRRAYASAFRIVGNRADAEDVSQQAFADAFHALDRFSTDGRNNAFCSWLMTIVVNRSKDIRKSKRRSEQPLPDVDAVAAETAFTSASPSPETNASVAQQLDRYQEALRKIPAKYREVLVLKDIEQLPYEDIQARLHLPMTTLKIRVVRARNILRAALAADND